MGRKKSTQTIRRLVHLDNKSRKGWYVYVKTPDKRPSYYKKRIDVPIDAYLQYHLDKNKKRRKIKGSLKQYETVFTKRNMRGLKVSDSLKRFASRYLRGIKKRPTIQGAIKGGITNTTLTNIHGKTESDIRGTYYELLKPLVLDNKLLDLLTLEENINKIKNRFQYDVKLLDRNGSLIEQFTKSFNTTLREVVEDSLNTFRIGMTFRDISNEGKTFARRKEYSIQAGDVKNNLHRIDIEVTFRYR